MSRVCKLYIYRCTLKALLHSVNRLPACYSRNPCQRHAQVLWVPTTSRWNTCTLAALLHPFSRLPAEGIRRRGARGHARAPHMSQRILHYSKARCMTSYLLCLRGVIFCSLFMRKKVDYKLGCCYLNMVHVLTIGVCGSVYFWAIRSPSPVQNQ